MSAVDFPETLYLIRNKVIRFGEDFEIETLEFDARIQDGNVETSDGRSFNLSDLMNFTNRHSDALIPLYEGWCLPDQLDEARIQVVISVQEHIKERLEYFERKLGITANPVYSDIIKKH